MLTKTQTAFSIFGAFISWFAVIAQFVLNLQQTETLLLETLIRFFSFFTILTNLIVAVLLTSRLLPSSRLFGYFIRPGHSTAVAVYITVVGIIYQLFLRNIWNPQGLQKVLDILLHAVIPLFFVLYWYLFEDKKALLWKQLPAWLLYPACYALFIFIRGFFSHYYPYPFIDVSVLGYPAALFNTTALVLFFIFVSTCFMSIGRALSLK